MQTHLAEFIRDSEQGKEAEQILRNCVHCGFCNATCPTYQLLGDELDGPRGRIYLIKQMLEGSPATRKTQLHLDRCLTCRSCETTCPSGVRYGKLLDIGRSILEANVKRKFLDRLVRKSLRLILPFSDRILALIAIGRKMLPLLPASLKRKVPGRQETSEHWPQPRHSRKMLRLNGCVQHAAAPQIDLAAAQVLDSVGISLVQAPQGGCCGALSYHLSQPDEALDFVRRNIDAWWPWIESGIEAIMISASGCGVMVKDYADLLKNDPDYAAKARRVSMLSKDIAEVLYDQDRSVIKPNHQGRVAFHSPCTLQHGQKINGMVEKILLDAGYTLCAVENPHLCCGSAGAYSILQKTLSERLLAEKIKTLEKEQPELIATANIGCLLAIQAAIRIPVKHWIELLVN
ncbi:MAG: glycolate oxidase subunit GlcF [Methylococcaceae bacterium]|nr:glycolate oxidase subunit GlcF [Methylococcaceae bacterium]